MKGLWSEYIELGSQIDANGYRDLSESRYPVIDKAGKTPFYLMVRGIYRESFPVLVFQRAEMNGFIMISIQF